MMSSASKTATGARGPRLAEATAELAPRAGSRYLRYLAGLVVLLGLFARSDLLSPRRVAVLVAGIVVVTVAGLAVALGRTDVARPSPDPRHYLIPVMAVLV